MKITCILVVLNTVNTGSKGGDICAVANRRANGTIE